VVVIKTAGDRLQEAPLSEVGGKGLFVKEIEEALLNGEVDLAVHSSKDMSAVLPPGLTIAGVLPREDPLDAVVLPRSVAGRTIDRLDQLVAHLGDTPTLGTGSVRRVAQLKRLLPNARFKQIRGNVETRLRKLDHGEYDAIVLAAAGLRRLNLGERISFRIPAPSCLPAPGQGIVAIEARSGDAAATNVVAAINDSEAEAALIAERAVVEALGGGCQTPIGAFVSKGDPNDMELLAVVVSLDGSRAIHGMAHGMRDEAAQIGMRVGAQLLADGAGEILDEARRAAGGVERMQP
jgi:hydroxymethylbilane synthase